jgi:hypothetical protein
MVRVQVPREKPRREVEAELGRAVLIRAGFAYATTGPTVGSAKLHEFLCADDPELHMRDLRDALATHATSLGLDSRFAFGGVLTVDGFPDTAVIDGIRVRPRLTMRMEQQPGILETVTFVVGRADTRWVVDGSLESKGLASNALGETAVRIAGNGPARGRIRDITPDGVLIEHRAAKTVEPAGSYSVAARSSFVRTHYGPATLRRLQVAGGSLAANGMRNRYAVKDRFASLGELMDRLGWSFNLSTGEAVQITLEWAEVRIQESTSAP